MFGPACDPDELKLAGHPTMVLRGAYVSRGKDIGFPADVLRWPIWRRRGGYLRSLKQPFFKQGDSEKTGSNASLHLGRDEGSAT